MISMEMPMFNLLRRKPKPPVSFEEKVWLEDSFIWLLTTFGYKTLRKHPQLTVKSAEFLLAQQHGDGLAEGLLRLVCKRMGVPREDIELVFYDANSPTEVSLGLFLKNEGSGAAGLYQQIGAYSYRISYDLSLIRDPEALVAVLAHEVGHIVLLGYGHMTGHEEDHEWMTDLIALFYGFGVIAANSMHREYHTSHSWSYVKQGYFSMPMYAYALALVIWIQHGMEKPEWLKKARLNVRSWCKQSLNFLLKTGDTSVLSKKIPFDSSALPTEVVLIKKRMKLAVLLEEYERAALLKSFLENEYFTQGRR